MWGPRRAAANTSASRGAYQVVGRWIQQLHVHAALARRELNETASRLESARMPITNLLRKGDIGCPLSHLQFDHEKLLGLSWRMPLAHMIMSINHIRGHVDYWA